MIYARRRPVRRHHFPALGNLLHNVVNAPVKDVVKDNEKFTYPAVNVKEYEDKFELHLAVPGYAKKDIDINVDGNTLTISSEKESFESEKFTMREFNYGKFRRQFNLPEDVDGEKIEAKFLNGVLTLEIPKMEEVKPRKITIK